MIRNMGKWKFETLADCWKAVRHINSMRSPNRQKKAYETFLLKMTAILRKGLDDYLFNVKRLDWLTGGAISKPLPEPIPSLPGMLESNHLTRHEKLGANLTEFFDKMLAMPEPIMLEEWNRILDDHSDYSSLLARLARDFANFEGTVIALPGTDPIIASPMVQDCLEKMFRLNMRNIRLMEMARDLRKTMTRNPQKKSYGFFKPYTDIGRLVRHMLLEYMIEADPVRIAQKQDEANRSGKPFVRYRFWRSAESLRQMAQVSYEPGPNRLPTIGKPFVESDIDELPMICTDRNRLDWAIKELFNNALAATSSLRMTRHNLVVESLPKHSGPNPVTAIRISLKKVTRRVGLRKKNFARLIIADEGNGISPEILPMTKLWAYSVRRADLVEQAEKIHSTGQAEDAALMIGGKGIGIPFALAIVKEHGGQFNIASTHGHGTTVTIDLPLPGPFKS